MHTRRFVALPEQVRSQARRTPGAVALWHQGSTLDYAALDLRVARMSARLRAAGVARGDFVGVLLDRGVDLLVALLAVHRAGAAYVPLDPSHPRARISRMAADSGLRLLISSRECLTPFDPPPDAPTLIADEDDGADCGPEPEHPLGPDDVAYLLYTSGSTGAPKGVLVTHGAVANFLASVRVRPGLAAGDVLAAVTTCCFDISVAELFLPLVAGGTVVMGTSAQAHDPRLLGELLDASGATHFQATPTGWRMLLDTGWTPPPGFTAWSGGEKLAPDLARRLYASCAHVWDLYGPTETTVYSACGRVAGSAAIDFCAMDNTTLHVVDEEFSPAAEGELLIGGAGLAHGYLGRPGLTAERFVPDPWQPGARLYRSGDVARHRPDGRLEIVGRTDHQVKIRGHRVEPGEIEAALMAHHDVLACAVHPFGTPARLAAYVVPRAGADPSPAALREHLAVSLPDYLIPAHFVRLAALPVSTSGKVDRTALPAPALEREHLWAAYVPPESPTEITVAETWQEALGIDRVGLDDDFLELGGDSLTAARMTVRISRTLGRRVPLRGLFEHRTARAFATWLDLQEDETLTGVPARDRGRRPLSSAQLRLWLLDHMGNGGDAYNLPLVLRLGGTLDQNALLDAVRELIARHEVLRSRFTWDGQEPAQEVMPVPAVTVSVSQVGADRDAAGEVRSWLERLTLPAFDLENAAPCRVGLLRVGPEEHLLALVTHHIAIDGWSEEIVQRDLADLYRALSRGGDPEQAPPAVRYGDYAAWQREAAAGAGEHLSYWRNKLAGVSPLDLPTDRPRPPTWSSAGTALHFEIEEPLRAGVTELARQRGVTPYMVLLASFQVLLGRYAGATDVAVGTVLAGRGRAEFEGIVGLFANTVVMRADLSGAPAFSELLDRTRRDTLDAHEHQDLPFDVLVKELAPERDPSRNPLFQVMFAFQNTPDARADWGAGLSAGREPRSPGYSTTFDLTLSLRDSGEGGWSGYLEYGTALFDQETIQRLAGHYRTLLAAVIAEPGAAVDEVPLFEDGTRPAFPAPTGLPALTGSLPDLVEERARVVPGAPAVVCGQRRLTYGEFSDAVNRLAHHLRESGAGPGVLVALHLPRGVDLVVSMLAVARAGGYYLALDPDHPAGRTAAMVADAAPRVLITAHDLPSLGIPGVVRLDADAAAIAARPATRPPGTVTAGDPLALIYTSGSTGTPKGVVITHGNVLSAVSGRAAYRDQPRSVLLPMSFTFDVFLSFLAWTLCSGGEFVLPAGRGPADLDELAVLARERRVSHVVGPPRLIGALLEHDETAFCTIRVAVTGGEACPIALLDELARRAPELTLINEYGPTEASWGSFFDASLHRVPDGMPTLPIGVPPSRYRLHLWSTDGVAVPLGAAGELVIGGPGVTSGYLGRPRQTAAQFVPDPAGPPGSRAYRTGDLARVGSDGLLRFLGRADGQVKIRGHRVELGEIEAVLAAHPDLAAVALAYDVPAQRLTAYVVAAAGGAAPGPAELRAFLAPRLPAHMVPATYVALERLPLTSHGKIDRAALPEPPAQPERAGTPPRNAVEELVAEVWAEVLGIPACQAEDSFFDLDGNSLSAARAVAAVRARLPVDIGVPDLFGAPTVAAFAELLAARMFEALSARPAALEAPNPVPAPRPQYPPLSYGQERLWLLDRMHPGSTDYVAPVAWRLRGELDVDSLRGALDGLVSRHDVLRTRYELRDGEPRQVIDPPEPVVLARRDLREATRLAEVLQAECARGVDLAKEWPLRAVLFRLGADEHVLLLVVHHIACDAWSLAMMTGELDLRYRALCQGRPPELPPLAAQYADHAVAQRARPDDEESLRYWRDRLAGLAELTIPHDRPRPPVRDRRGATLPFELAPELAGRVRALAREHGATPFMVLLAAFQVLLGRYCGQQDIAVGTPVARRDGPGEGELIGFFVDTVVLRGDLRARPTFHELLERVREGVLGDLAHQGLPFERLARELAPERDASRNPLFQVMFSYQNAPAAAPALGTLDVSTVQVPATTSKFDLTLEVEEHAGGGMSASLEYATALFDRTTMAAFAERYAGVLRQALERPAETVDGFDILTAAEHGDLLTAWNDTGVERPARLLHELVERQAAATPGAVAVIEGGNGLTYAELEAAAGGLAGRLRAAGVGQEQFVAVCLPRGLELVVTLLAVLKAGAAYVPLDPGHPPERLATVLRESGASAIVTGAEQAARLPHLPPLVIQPQERGPVLGPVPGPVPATDLDSPAYAIFTSGSTGTPKGVTIPHRGIVNRVLWTIRRHGLTAADRVLQKTTISFDAAGWEIFAPLAVGGSVVLASPGAEYDPSLIVSDLVQHDVSVLQVVPSMLRLIVEEPALAGCESLRLVFSAGEPLTADLCGRLRARIPVELHNTYGPTECSIDVTAWQYRTGAHGGTVPIGGPIDNTAIRILDDQLRLVPVGVPGELCVTGAGLARGYLGRPDLTAERFVPDPYGRPGARVYRTGDLARWRPDGTIDFIGRLDHQIKVRGVRVEPAEVEACLAGHPEVTAAAVLAKRDPHGDTRLVAYVQPASRAGLSVDMLRLHLSARLPEPMVPSIVIPLERLPYTHSGKLDRAALPEPDLALFAARGEYVAPRDATEEVIASVFADVLGLERVGVHDSFFSIGGNSMIAMRAVARLRETLSAQVSMGTLLDARTVAELARRLAAPLPEDAGTLEPAPTGGPLPLSSAQHRMWHLHAMDPESREYLAPIALRLRGPLDDRALLGAVEAIQARHEPLRTRYEVSGGEPYQVIDEPAPVLPYRVDLEREGGERRAAELVTEWASRPFDLSREAPLRVALARLADRDHVLLLLTHHIACDGRSLDVLARELGDAYNALRAGEQPAWGPLPARYADYAAWESGPEVVQVRDRRLARWRDELAGVAPLDLPVDRPRPPLRDAEGAVLEIRVPAETARRVLALGQERGATPFMTWLAAFEALLGRYTGRTGFLVGTPVAGRDLRAVEDLVGCFVNTMMVRADVSGRPDLGTLIERSREAVLAALDHRDVPLEGLVEVLGVERDLSRVPLVDVMLTVEDTALTPYRLQGLDLEPFPVGHRAAMCDLTLTLAERPDGAWAAEFEYAAALFDRESVQRMAGDFVRLLESAASDPAVPPAEVPLVAVDTPAEPRTALAVPDAVAAWARCTPGAVAVVAADGDGGTYSYALLDRLAAHLAARLVAAGVRPGDIVASRLPRGPHVAVALLGIMRAGGVYVPLDTESPAERLDGLLADIGPAAVVTEGRDGIPVIQAGEAPIVELPRIRRDDLAYMIYTSGSTGRPKGVQVEHGSFGEHCVVMAAAYGLAPGECLALMASVTFDASLDQIAAALVTGATVVVCDPRNTHPEDLADQLTDRGVTVVDLTPAYYRELVGVLRPGDGRLTGLRLMSVGGDAVTYADARAWARTGLPARFLTGYGPTETTIAATMHAVNRDVAAPDALVPLGRPLDGTGAYVLDANGAAAPYGVIGELHIGGSRVGRGYHRAPGLTAAQFLPDPYSPVPGARMYATGDLVRRRSDGVIEFVGRGDRQIKIRGFRVEPGEIEAILATHQAVRAAVVEARRAPRGDLRLVCYLVAGAHPAELAAHLRERLPDYMVPAAWVELPELPLTQNNKVDRAALPDPDWSRPELAREYVEPESEMERYVSDLWAELLEIERVGRDDDFFILGGNSLLASRVLLRLREALDLPLSLRQIFAARTVAAMGELLENAIREEISHWTQDQLMTLLAEGEQA